MNKILIFVLFGIILMPCISVPAFSVDGDTVPIGPKKRFEKALKTVIRSYRNPNPDAPKSFLEPKNEEISLPSPGCIHVSAAGIKVALWNIVQHHRPELSLGDQAILVGHALETFYKDYTVEIAEICNRTARKICGVVLDKNNESECKEIKNSLASSMSFSRVCEVEGAKNCDTRFEKESQLPLREAKGLIELLAKVEKGNDVYCSNNVRIVNDKRFLQCKFIDNKAFTDYEFVFSDIRETMAYESVDFLRMSLVDQVLHVLWPGKQVWNSSDTASNNSDISGFVSGISGAECIKYNKELQDIFNGMAKMKNDGLCEVRVYPGVVTKHEVVADFDKNGFGTDWKYFSGETTTLSEDIVVKYLVEKASKHGKTLTDVHCDNTFGMLDNFDGRFLRCYGTFEGKVLTEDFGFGLSN